MPITPDSVLLTGRRAVVTGAAQGIGAAGRDHARPLRRRRRDLRPRRRRLWPRLQARLRRWAGTRTPSCSTCATPTLCRRGSTPLESGRRARQQRGRRVPRAVPRRERQGPGRADPRELRERDALHPCVRRRRCPSAGGSIVNITSIEAHRAAPGYAVYSAMKAALVNLSQSLALELGARRIRVNCIAPDVIPTPGIGGDLPIEDAAAVRGAGRRRRRRRALPRVRLVALRHRHHDPRRRRQPRGRRLGPRGRRRVGSPPGEPLASR